MAFDPNYKHTGLDRFSNIEQYLVSNGGSQPLLKNQLNNPFGAGTLLRSGSTYQLIGWDLTAEQLLVKDTGGGGLRRSTSIPANGSPSWSNLFSAPTNVDYSKGAMCRAGDYVYLLSLNTVTSVYEIYRATPQTNTTTAWTWSSLLASFTSGATGGFNAQGGFEVNDTYIFAPEYGAPAGGVAPKLWRATIADGTDWTNIFAPTGWHHIHCVAQDPYPGGLLWMSGGDGIADPIKYSADDGVTWTTIPTQGGHIPQVVQLGFDENYVYCLGDSEYTGVVVIDKATKQWWNASTNSYSNFAVPGSTNTFQSPFFLTHDPDNHVTYVAASSGTGFTSGLFFQYGIGGRMELLKYGDAIGLPLIHNGRLWTGQVSYPLLSFERATSPTTL